MTLKLITKPKSEPVTLEEAKAHLRVINGAEDSLINGLITTAREYCESYQNRAYITQTWELWLDKWPEKNFIKIPKPPLQSVQSVKFYSIDGTEYTLDTGEYYVDDKSEPGRISLAYNKSWPSVTLRPINSICVTFTAGYLPTGEGENEDPAGNVPQAVKQAVKLLIGHWYENREAVLKGAVSKEIEFAVQQLLWTNRGVPI